MRQIGSILISLIIYAVIAAAVAGTVYGAYAYVKGIGAKAEREIWEPKLTAMTQERDDVRAKYEAFAADVDAKGKEQARRVAELNAENERREAERTKGYEKQIAALRADNQRIVERVRRQFAGAGAGSNAVRVPEVSGAPGPPGPGTTDEISDLRRALSGLARDCAETTVMFLECRDSWKDVAR